MENFTKILLDFLLLLTATSSLVAFDSDYCGRITVPGVVKIEKESYLITFISQNEEAGICKYSIGERKFSLAYYHPKFDKKTGITVFCEKNFLDKNI